MDENSDDIVAMMRGMGTTDRDVLVSNFCNLAKVEEGTASTFLEANNWNLQVAVDSYYESQSPEKRFKMTVVSDDRVEEKECYLTGTNFVRRLKLLNSGKEPWPVGCCLFFVHGANLSGQNSIPILALNPGETFEIDIQMDSPMQPGLYLSEWRMMTLKGTYFGDFVVMKTHVVEDKALLTCCR